MGSFFNSSFYRLGSYVYPERYLVGGAVTSAIVKASASAGLAFELKQILDRAAHGARVTDLLMPTAIGLALSTMIFTSALSSRALAIRITQDTVQDIRRRIVDKLIALTPGRVSDIGRTTIQSMALRDTDKIEAMLSHMLGVLLPGIITASALTIVLIGISPLVGVLTVGGAALIWLFSHAQRKSIQQNVALYEAAIAQFNRGLLITLERLHMVKAAGLESLEKSERREEITALRKLAETTERGATFSFELTSYVGNISILIALAVGTLLVGRAIAFGDLLTLYVILFLIRSQIAGIGSALADTKYGAAALRQVWRFLDIPNSISYQGGLNISFSGAVTLCDISFAYGSTAVLDGINVKIRPGECTVITGVNGSGKTTLLQLVLGLIRPSAGSICADDIAYEHVDFSILREAMSFLPQDPLIFDGTILQNITFGRPHLSQREIERAVTLAGARSVVDSSSDGLRSEVGDMGLRLSGGERQRIALARAIIGRPRLLIMDEPTNHLDADAIESLVYNLKRIEDSPAILIVSHDRIVAANADHLFHLEHGKLSKIEARRGRLDLILS